MTMVTKSGEAEPQQNQVSQYQAEGLKNLRWETGC